MVHLASQAETDLAAFEDFVRKQPLVRECCILSNAPRIKLRERQPDG